MPPTNLSTYISSTISDGHGESKPVSPCSCYLSTFSFLPNFVLFVDIFSPLHLFWVVVSFSWIWLVSFRSLLSCWSSPMFSVWKRREKRNRRSSRVESSCALIYIYSQSTTGAAAEGNNRCVLCVVCYAAALIHGHGEQGLSLTQGELARGATLREC